MPPKTKDFEDEINRRFHKAETKGSDVIVLISGTIHRAVGGYPKRNHRMRLCCEVMRKLMNKGDEILDEPDSGQGPSLTIKYLLPRD